jgi:hypothetical protein
MTGELEFAAYSFDEGAILWVDAAPFLLHGGTWTCDWDHAPRRRCAPRATRVREGLVSVDGEWLAMPTRVIRPSGT